MWLGLALMALICGAAFWQGGRWERLAAAGFVLGVLTSVAVKDRHWIGVQWAMLAVDVGYLGLLVVIAFASDRFWPIAASGFQLLGVVTHAARLIDPHVGAWAYITAGVIWTWLIMGALALGTYNYWRDRRQLAASGLAMAEPGATRR